ncbi:unnamed protein product [Sphenostylis stenocarpa]|uniref:Uncharacterized protein n=1 Tax=Sphenostylis stenocarpa TaxID=92480 RepID=A0AA86S1S8_9FABA|nr:unnamed protein product [Sphenostylis stenocarpa]
MSNLLLVIAFSNRAFCYSQLELHRHVIEDRDRALQLDPARLTFPKNNRERVKVTNALSLNLAPAYSVIRAVSSLGRKGDAVLVWEQGYEHAQHQSSDLKLLLELEELLTTAKHGNISFEDGESNKSDSQVNGSPDIIDEFSYNSESDTSESRDNDKTAKYPEALIGRGTAYAFKPELDAAIADLSKAWKRRRQARAALGEFVEAIEDLAKALEFESNSADILHERDRDNKSAYTYLGLALSLIGEYKKAEYAHLKSLQIDRIFLEAWAHLTQVTHVSSVSDRYNVVGEDFWSSTWCSSAAFEGKQLEGTRITFVKIWEDYDTEMAMAWEAICNAYCGEITGLLILMCLKIRIVVILGLFLAANMEFTGSIPQGLQVDWEATLHLDSNSFVDSIKSWLYPSVKVTTSWKDYHDVASTFPTTGSVVAALSASDD